MKTVYVQNPLAHILDLPVEILLEFGEDFVVLLWVKIVRRMLESPSGKTEVFRLAMGQEHSQKQGRKVIRKLIELGVLEKQNGDFYTMKPIKNALLEEERLREVWRAQKRRGRVENKRLNPHSPIGHPIGTPSGSPIGTPIGQDKKYIVALSDHGVPLGNKDLDHNVLWEFHEDVRPITKTPKYPKGGGTKKIEGERVERKSKPRATNARGETAPPGYEHLPPEHWPRANGQLASLVAKIAEETSAREDETERGNSQAAEVKKSSAPQAEGR